METAYGVRFTKEGERKAATDQRTLKVHKAKSLRDIGHFVLHELDHHHRFHLGEAVEDLQGEKYCGGVVKIRTRTQDCDEPFPPESVGRDLAIARPGRGSSPHLGPPRSRHPWLVADAAAAAAAAGPRPLPRPHG